MTTVMTNDRKIADFLIEELKKKRKEVTND